MKVHQRCEFLRIGHPITPASLAITGVRAQNRIYDGTTTALLVGAPTVSAFSGDNVIVIGAGSGAFTDKNTGVGKNVLVNGFSLSGADAANYTAVQPVNLTANISAPELSLIGALHSSLLLNQLGTFNENMLLPATGSGEPLTRSSALSTRSSAAFARTAAPDAVSSSTEMQMLRSGVFVAGEGIKLPANRVKLKK